MKKTLDVEIKKPLYKYFVYIRDTKIEKAKKNNLDLRIITPDGTYIISVKKFMKDAKKMSKVFLRPGEPMILFGNYVTKGKEETKTSLTKRASQIALHIAADYGTYMLQMYKLRQAMRKALGIKYGTIRTA